MSSNSYAPTDTQKKKFADAPLLLFQEILIPFLTGAARNCDWEGPKVKNM